MKIAVPASVSLFSGLLLSAAVQAQTPYMEPDDTYITLSGSVESVEEDSFELNYGQGSITVEMDDGDRDADAYQLLEGDKVTVSGMIDDDFYELTKIEASSVYVESIDSYFFASSTDEEERYFDNSTPVEVSETTLIGTVSDIGVDDFTINSGLREVTIEVDDLPYDPLDDEGYQKIDEGDMVSVSGYADYDLFENHSFEADNVTTLVES